MLKELPKEVYKAISFEQGNKPDFDFLVSLFIENGLFINNKGEQPVIKTVPDYVKMIETNIDNGNIVSIKEEEISNEVIEFGNVAQITSKYELVFEGALGSQTRYGVNLFQLIRQNESWSVSSMCWDDRTDKSLIE